MNRTALGWAAIACTLALTVWASLPNSPLFGWAADLVPGGDKTGHVLVMGALAAGCVVAFSYRNVAGHRLTPGLVLGAVALGATADELAQAFIDTRTFDWLDLAASLAGVAVLGGLAAFAMLRRERVRDAAPEVV